MNETPANYESKRQTFNQWIRNNAASQGFIVADMGADSRIGDAGDESNLTYYVGDLCHVNNTGASVAAEYFRSALAAFGVGSTFRVPEPILIPAQDFNSAQGTNELDTHAGGLRPAHAWSFDKDATEQITRTMRFPHGTGPLSVDLIWYSGYTGGSVAWSLAVYEYAADQVIYPSVPTPSPNFNFGTPSYDTAYQIKEHRMGSTGIFVPDSTRFQTIVIGRTATHAADTLPGDARLLGVRFTPVTVA